MKHIIVLFVIFLTFSANDIFAQRGAAIDPNDPVITFDSNNPPAFPPPKTIGKWVRTRRYSWSTPYKCYIYDLVPFRLKFPKNYDPNKKYPLTLFFHGRGERPGTLRDAQGNVIPNYYDNENSLKHGGRQHMQAVDNGTYDGFLLYPQSLNGMWTSSQPLNAMREVIDILIDDLGIVDENRITIHGLSSGGGGVWNFLASNSDLVAGAVPMSATSAIDFTNLLFTPLWLVQGGLDRAPTPAAANGMAVRSWDAGGNFRYTLYEDLGHGVWGRTWKESDFYPFMNRANKTNPWTLFGKTEFCPGDPVNVTIGVTPGFDEYEWRKDGIVVFGQSSHKINVSDYGVYDVRIRRGNKWSYWSPIPVEIKVKAPTQTPPIQVSGLFSNVIPSPDGKTSVTLELPEGFSDYEWRNVSTNQVVGNERFLEVSTPGEYIATVTEFDGCSSNPSEIFKVVDANATNAPDPITGLTAYALSKTQVQLNWSDNPNAAYDETAFEIYRSLVSGGEYELITVLPANTYSYQDEELDAGARYYYVIRAVNDNAASDISEEADVITEVDLTPPSAPLNVAATSVSSSDVSIIWEASTDDVGVFSYDIFLNGNKVLVKPLTETSATIFGLQEGEVYNIFVKARDITGNESAPSNQVTVAAVNSGLNYKYYHGTWSSLPNFNSLTPVKTGVSDNVDISVREQDNNFAFLWEGNINIPVAGTYTFETRSDDGSKLYIGGYNEANLIVNNDGLHGMQSRTGTYNFVTPGAYPIAISFFERGGGQGMEVYWSSNQGLARQRIPDGVFRDDFELPGSAPSAPTSVSAMAVSYNQIDLVWEDNSDNETGFQIFRSISGSGPFYSVETVDANSTSFSDNTVEAETTYYYKVQAVGRYGESALQNIVPSANAYWKFDSDFSDASGNNIAAIPLGEPIFNTNDFKAGSASLNFDGTDDIVELGDNSGSGELHDEFSERTVSFWMKPTASNNRVIYDEGGSTNGMAVRLNNGRVEVAVINNGRRRTRNFSISLNTWTHVAAVFNRSRLSLYINGEEKAVYSNTGYTSVGSHSDNAALGSTSVGGSNAFNSTGRKYVGLLDDIRLFRQALTVEDIALLLVEEGPLKPYATTLPLPPSPAGPSELVATANSSSKITLSWTDASNDEEGFRVYRSVSANDNFILQETLPSGSSSYEDEGLFTNVTYFYKVSSYNVGGEVESIEVSAKTLNNPPVLDELQDFTVRFGTSYELNLFSEDPDVEQLTLSTSNLPTFATFEDYTDGSGLITLNPTETDLGDYTFTVSVSDENGGSDSKTVTVTVNSNFLPVVNVVQQFEVTEGTSGEITLTASDENILDELAWTINGLPSFMTFTNNLDRSAKIEINPAYIHAGTYPINITVEDGNGGNATKEVVITIVDAEPSVAIERTIKVNFSVNNNAPAPWNNTSKQPVVNDVFNNLIDDSSTDTGIGMKLLTSWGEGFNSGATTGDNSGIVPDAALDEYWWFGIWWAPESVQVELFGLDPSKSYNFKFVGSSTFICCGYTENGETNYSINGQVASLDVHFNTSSYAGLSNIRPDADGKLIIDMSKGNGATIGYVNAMIIEEFEPSTELPAAPKNLVASYSNEIVDLSWQDAPFNEIGFEVFRATTMGGEYTKINSQIIPVNATSYGDESIGDNQAYFYKVRSFNENGVSEFSNIVEIFIPNKSPLIAPIEDIYMTSNSTYPIEVSVEDGSPLTLTAINIPAFASFMDNGDGMGSFTFSPSSNDIGIYTVTLSAEDASGLVSTEDFAIYVKDDQTRTVSINFSKDENAGYPWNNTQKDPIVNDYFGDLNDDLNQNSGIGIKLLNSWGEAFKQGAVTGNDSGIVPDAVLSEYWWFGAFWSPGNVSIEVDGLDDSKVYNFKFIGSSTFSEGETRYIIGNESVSLDVWNNTSELVQISGISPTNGSIIIDMEKATGVEVGYINGMIIDINDASFMPKPSNLKVSALSTSELGVSWLDNTANESGFEIYRSSTGGNDFELIATTPVNTTSFEDTNLPSNTTYYYKVRAIGNGTQSDFSGIVSGTTIDYVVLVNFNNLANQFNAHQNAPAPWNNTNKEPIEGASLNNLIDTKNQFTGININFDDGFDGDFPDGTVTGDNSGIYPDNVLISYYYIFPGRTATITITGLRFNYLYDFKFSGNWHSEASSTYSVNNENTTLRITNNVASVATIENQTPDEFGSIQIVVSVPERSPAAVINALEIVGKLNPNAANLRMASKIGADITVKDEISIDDREINVYPNPFLDELNIALGNIEGDLGLFIYDISGRVIDRKFVNTDELSSSKIYKLSLGNIIQQTGTYILIVKSDLYTKQFKLIKQ